jgi:hypothetical protein
MNTFCVILSENVAILYLLIPQPQPQPRCIAILSLPGQRGSAIQLMIKSKILTGHHYMHVKTIIYREI